MGEGLYLNTGTWADLISFPYEKLDQGEEASLRWLTEFARDLETDQIQQYIMRIPTYAKVELFGEREVLHADIHEFEAGKGIV